MEFDGVQFSIADPSEVEEPPPRGGGRDRGGFDRDRDFDRDQRGGGRFDDRRGGFDRAPPRERERFTTGRDRDAGGYGDNSRPGDWDCAECGMVGRVDRIITFLVMG